MNIILDSYNRRVWDGAADPVIWKTIAGLLKADLRFFRECLLYWSNTDYADSEMEHAFGIAPAMRQLLHLAQNKGLLVDVDCSGWCDDVIRAVFS